MELWYPGADRIPGSGATYNVDSQFGLQAAVVHVGEGWLNTWIEWALSGRMYPTFHFGVGLSGRVVQFYRLDRACAHAGGRFATLHPFFGPTTANPRAVGIEHEGFSNGKSPDGNRVDQWNDRQIGESADLMSWLCDNFGWPKSQIVGTDSTGYLGHYQIATNRTEDPGPFFPWAKYERLIRAGGDDMTPDQRELQLLLASILFGNENGVPFRNEQEALVEARRLESPQNDARILMGQGILQGDMQAVKGFLDDEHPGWERQQR